MTLPGSFKARLHGIYFELYKMLYTLNSTGIIPNTVIDIGASKGMFTKAVNYVYPTVRIIAFEPFENCF